MNGESEIAPGFPPHLAGGEIHVWVASLSEGHCDPRDDDFLSGDERARAARFAAPAGRARFARSRRLLREVLGGYLGQSPETLRLALGTEGKPFLEDAAGRPECALRFNLTHSGELWAVAVRRDAEVGVDVERVDRRGELLAIARRLFTDGEVAGLEALPDDERRDTFFRLWAAREALVKCVGAGIFSDAREFEISAPSGQPLAVRGVGEDPFPWTVYDIAVPDAFRGAVATLGEPVRVRVWEWGD